MIINLKIEDITILDVNNPDPLTQIKLISDFDTNYQVVAEAKFILWKFLAILKYADINIDELSFYKNENQKLD